MNFELIIGGWTLACAGYVVAMMSSMCGADFKTHVSGSLALMCGGIVMVTGAMI